MRRKNILYILLICLMLVFIWGNSALPGEISGEISKGFLKQLLSIFGRFGEKAEFVLRKCAHFSEFCVLGVLLIGWMNAMGQRGIHRIAHAGFLGLIAACVDETIQIYSPGRYSSLLDVWVDSAGVLVGILLMMLLLHRISRRKTDKPSVSQAGE